MMGRFYQDSDGVFHRQFTNPHHDSKNGQFSKGGGSGAAAASGGGTTSGGAVEGRWTKGSVKVSDVQEGPLGMLKVGNHNLGIVTQTNGGSWMAKHAEGHGTSVSRDKPGAIKGLVGIHNESRTGDNRPYDAYTMSSR